MARSKSLEALFGLMYAVKVQFAQELGAEGLSIAPMHIKLLKRLSACDNCTAQEIALAFRRDKAQIARLVQDLIRANLIARSPNPADKRSHLLELTTAGRNALRQTKKIDDRVIEKMLAGTSAADGASFISIAEKYKANLEIDQES